MSETFPLNKMQTVVAVASTKVLVAFISITILNVIFCIQSKREKDRLLEHIENDQTSQVEKKKLYSSATKLRLGNQVKPEVNPNRDVSFTASTIPEMLKWPQLEIQIVNLL